MMSAIYHAVLCFLFAECQAAQNVAGQQVQQELQIGIEQNMEPRLGIQEKKKSLPTMYKAPDFKGLTNWINSESYTSLEELRGKVVLIDFWTLGCINCIRTLPYVEALYTKYKDDGFVVIGIHAPEFAYEHKLENVKAAVTKHGLTYPVVQDNDFTTWRNYKNRYWPAHYLIDKEGNVRWTHFGEGAYEEMDRNVKELLEEQLN